MDNRSHLPRNEAMAFSRVVSHCSAVTAVRCRSIIDWLATKAVPCTWKLPRSILPQQHAVV